MQNELVTSFLCVRNLTRRHFLTYYRLKYLIQLQKNWIARDRRFKISILLFYRTSTER